MAQVDPDNIENFSIMKDATAAALYGSKGANGVISVTTKMGREGKLAISFRHESRFSMPTMLPGAAFFLGMSYPPAREMIASGLAVALASDYNPGSSPSGNMRMVMSLASIRMKMTPNEALTAATLNGAYAMGVSDKLGSISVGKVANFFITKPMPSPEFFVYAYCTPLIAKVFLRGEEYS